MKKLFDILNDFLNLLYPRTCLGCGNSLLKNEKLICLKCRYDLPKTNYYKNPENPVSQLFWGRVYIENAASYLQFNKGGKVQKLIHELKYNGKKEVGYELGKYFGAELVKSPSYNDFDMIVPVPLHKKRERKRGYNQSEMIAKGLSDIMKTPINTDVLYRIKASETQTKKSRFERWENVESIFDVRNKDILQNKHVLLVDDVVTTGATLEACATTLLKTGNVKVSIAAIASA